jgi:SAM-dependent methyltransferase
VADRPYPDLDYEFQRYTGVVPENQRRIQSFYLPFFEGRRRVLDLACGDGDFVQMLAEQGTSAVGVDFDPKACQVVRARGLDVICQDVFDYLEQAEPESVDGIFSAHLVEHLAYHQVLRMLELSLRALKPGGIILLVTPNVRSTYTHLESYYKHFGHISYYHPELLCFFLDYVGFTDPQMGENPRMATPLWGEPAIFGRQQDWSVQPIPYVTYERVLPLPSDNALRRAIRSVKMFLVRMIVQPYIDQVVVGVNQSIANANRRLADVSQVAAEATRFLGRVRETLDRPVECYAYAYKAMENNRELFQRRQL